MKSAVAVQNTATNAALPNKKIPNPTRTSNEARKYSDPLTIPLGFISEKYQQFIIEAEEIVGEQNMTVITDVAKLSHEHCTKSSKAHDGGKDVCYCFGSLVPTRSARSSRYNAPLQ